MRTRAALTTLAVVLGMALSGAPPAVAGRPGDRPPETTRPTRPKPTVAPSPTVSPRPTASPTPTVRPTLSPSPTVRPTPTVSPTPTVRPTPTASPTGTPAPTTPAPMPTADRAAVVLPGLDGPGSTAYDVNSAGVVVGAAELASGYWHAVRWVDGRIEDLGTLGGLNSQAEAIDERGRIVGFAQAADGSAHAVAWVNGKIQDLGLTGGIFSVASDTAGDRVVGTYHVTDSFSGRRAFVRTGNTEITIDAPPGASAVAVNEAGTVAGTYGFKDWTDPPFVQQAFVWRDGVLRSLGTLGGPNSTANGINDLGQVVGTSWTAEGQFAAFFWDGSAMRRLATGSASPTAQAVNDSGLVIGTDGTGGRAMIWPTPTAGSQLLPLPDGAVDSVAINVNDAGLVVGQANYLAPRFHGRAVVWR
ncbi:hypothetical protein [Micromonospora humi]|uniref:Probable extracellular repeat, HAF family n=1 Tax=Micromonospora humi TaxID=745366 RepID=A0A1C5I4N4_9ACTN|nr:hypothetical protein [Micromonospora humi]SCG52956.1 probable extracellular repeat, HAF family [Micromonospora humi]